eukprot:m.52902 g.52902  ORF g.52902 m.52902 type:complete len:61 (+) comp48509_c0_seq4:462-644(+)
MAVNLKEKIFSLEHPSYSALHMERSRLGKNLTQLLSTCFSNQVVTASIVIPVSAPTHRIN